MNKGMAKISNHHNDMAPNKPIRHRKAAARVKPESGAAIPALAAPMGGTEDNLVRQETISGELEKSLRERIYELEISVKEKDALLANSDMQVNAVNVDSQRIAVLEEQLREKEKLLHAKDLAIIGLEQSLNAQMQSLTNQFNAQQAILASREAQLDALTASLNAQTEELLQNRQMNERIARDTARLISEQREAKLALAKVEIEEWHSIGRVNAWKRLLHEVKRFFEFARGTQENERLPDQLSKPSGSQRRPG
jgi:hypothetical protein